MSSLLRSTKFVRYFAGAARTLILNSAKTAEANLLINSKALCVANNVSVRDYATSKKTESLEPLLQRLDSEVRRFGRISKRDIDEVFDELRGKHDITSSQSLLIIRCCGELVPEELPEQRTLLVQKIWSVLAERGVPMDISHYNALLRVYIENEHPFSPAEFLNELEKKGLQPNRVTYQRLMWRYCQEGDVEGATKVLEKMRELGLPVSEPVLNALVMGHAFHGDTDGARAVLETMAGAGLQPSNRTYALLACGFAKRGDLEGVEKVLKDANDKDAYITDKDILDIMESLAVAGHGDKIESLFGHLQKGSGYMQDLCNLILRLINKGQESVAINLMKTMPKKPEGDDTPYKGAFFVKQLLKTQKSPESIVKTCRELQEDNVVPNAIYIATEIALLQANSQLAMLLFKELEKNGVEIRQHFYWPLLAKKGKENDEEGLLQVLRDMGKAGLMPSGECLRDYVIPYLGKKDTPQNVMLKLQLANIPRILSARNVMVELLEAGKIRDAANIALEYRPFGQFNLVSRPLVTALAKTKDVKSFVTVLHVISSKVPQAEEDVANDEAQPDDKSDANVIGRIVFSAVKNIPNTLYEELLTEIHSKGLTISTSSAEAIEAYMGQNLTGAISEKLTQLASADLEIAPIELLRRTYAPQPRNSAQLEKLVAQAKSKDSANVTRLQKQLLILYVQENNLEKVNSFVKELESDNFELSNASLAMLCEFYAQNDDIEKALSYKKTLESKEPVFLLNKYKLVQIASAFIRANRFDEAVQFLKESQPDSHEGPTFSLNSRCWQVLNGLAEAKDTEKVIMLTKVLIENSYIVPSNVLLGPSIKAYLLSGDIEGALQQFENCCKQYRSTPWKGELMKALILKEDAAKLQWLADLSTQIHGEVNILHDLVLAFVECGRLRQARRILETPGMQNRQKRLQDACERYVQEGKSEYLEGLLEATKELSYIDRANIFYHLLVTYCKADETDKALGLWTLLQEEGEVPSDAFLTQLGSHLKSKNRSIPFAYASPEEPKPPKAEKKPKGQPTVTKKDATEQVEVLVKEGKLAEAMDAALKSIAEGVIPKANVLKYMLRKLADEGNVEMIERLGAAVTSTTKRNITYDDKLTLALFVRGDGAKHIDSLSQNVQNAKTEADLKQALIQFPRSNALASIVQNEELIGKCQRVAEIAASKGDLLPANLIWMEYFLVGKEQEAEKLWNQHLKNAEVIAFRRLLQECHTRNQPQLAEKLISTLKTNPNCTGSVIGNVYSRLINLHLSNSNTEDARQTLEKALSDGCTLENITKTSLKRLKESMATVGQEFKYTIP